VPDVVAEADL
jgi:hypothetical protein